MHTGEGKPAPSEYQIEIDRQVVLQVVAQLKKGSGL
jgi:hypothetical protein